MLRGRFLRNFLENIDHAMRSLYINNAYLSLVNIKRKFCKRLTSPLAHCPSSIISNSGQLIDSKLDHDCKSQVSTIAAPHQADWDRPQRHHARNVASSPRHIDKKSCQLLNIVKKGNPLMAKQLFRIWYKT